jgi:predicted nucleic acid-binding Zn ribbon protein
VGIIFKGSGFYATDHRSPSGQGKVEKGKTGENEKKSESSAPAETSTSTTEEKK